MYRPPNLLNHLSDGERKGIKDDKRLLLLNHLSDGEQYQQHQYSHL